MSEKEEEFKKKDEEKKRKEEQEELDKDKKLRLAREKLQELRPQHLEELRQINLDKAPIRELKGIMEKMGITSRGCISRKDLKEKLLENVPELRLQQSGQLSGAPGKHFISLCCVHQHLWMQSGRTSIPLERAKLLTRWKVLRRSWHASLLRKGRQKTPSAPCRARLLFSRMKWSHSKLRTADSETLWQGVLHLLQLR